uniref:Uncharacterized protein n=1 Tax=Anguilla anguilla TaxID=7936 RepID=A0A0E9UML2_ANGAN
MRGSLFCYRSLRAVS